MKLEIFVYYFFALIGHVAGTDSRPNIIFVLPDDLGWADVTWNNKKTLSTPFLNDLTLNATVLKQAYSTHRCTPSRASMLTGRYAFRYGLGSDPLAWVEPKGLSLGEKLLPELLQNEGYGTHAVGKWHLGFCNASYHPNNRGFDTHYGHYGGAIDYMTHAHSNGRYKSYLNHYYNSEPFRQETYDYSTYDWGQYTTKVLTENLDKPKFVYLAFNAPHETTTAPQNLIDRFKLMYKDMPDTRIEYLASLYAIDLTMKRLVQTAAQLERETIIIFQSDNGGSIHAYDVKVPMPAGESAPRACNFPYRGYKNSLFEGGTLSPAFVYSTKRQFASPQVDSIVHITDWFPTILKFAKYEGNVPRNLDGVDQSIVFESKKYQKPRTSFIYGVLNTWHEKRGEWLTQYAIRFGNWKFMNFRQDRTLTHKCFEGWENGDHAKYLFPTDNKHRFRMIDRLNDAAKNHTKPKGKNWIQMKPGFTLFDLEKDPFELRDLAHTKKVKKELLQVILDIQQFAVEEIQKGFEYPVTGKLYGKVLKMIMNRISQKELDKFLLKSGRLSLFEDPDATDITGYVGNDWCPATQDYSWLNSLYYEAISKDRTTLAGLIDLYLWDGYGPKHFGRSSGQTRRIIQNAGFLSVGNSEWNDPMDDW